MGLGFLDLGLFRAKDLGLGGLEFRAQGLELQVSGLGLGRRGKNLILGLWHFLDDLGAGRVNRGL